MVHSIRVSDRRMGPIALLLVGAALVGPASCHREHADTARPDLALANDKTPFSLEAATFEDEGTRQRLIALESCAREAANGGGHAIPWTLAGNFVEERWCNGRGAGEDCLGREYVRDQHGIELSTLHIGDGKGGYRGSYFGLKLRAAWVPPATGWGATFSFSEKGKDIVDASFGLTFARYTAEEGRPADTLTLANGYGYTIFEETKALATSTQPLGTDVARYIASADALREAGTALLAKARSEVEDLLSTHSAKVRAYAPHTDHGRPPPYELRDATPAEEAAELAKATRYFDTKDALLRANYNEMYAALLQAFPVDRCWK